MKRIRNILILLSFCIFAGPVARAQNPACNASAAGGQETTGTIFFNFGSVTNAVNTKNRHNSSVGELLVGPTYNQTLIANQGFWSRFLLPPAAPVVTATQGELLDRIQLSWSIDPLSPASTEGFHIYRDGVFLTGVDRSARSYNDFNVIAGVPYNYEIRGVNLYGEGFGGKALGFQVPNGVVTGQVQTLNGSPVPGALVTLLPMQGFSAKFGPTDGAFADSSQYLPAAGSAWSLSFWIKTDAATANAGILKLGTTSPLYIRAINSATGHEGVTVSASGAPFLSATFPDPTKNGWHLVALSFENGQGRLYLDGVLAALAPMSAIPSATDLSLGSRTGNDGWTGRLDELRIYHRRLDEIDLGEVMEGTAGSTTPGLKYYWKMDEEQGVKTFDIFKRTRIFFCGATFDPDRPPVRTSGLTNSDGYYKIESASYGTGTTFLAQPSKQFYAHRSLKFTRSENDYAILPDFPVTPKFTLEMWVNSAGPDGAQCLLYKKLGATEFRLILEPDGLNNVIRVFLNGATQTFGHLGTGYQHLAFTYNNQTGSLAVYKNGVLIGTSSFPTVSGDWSDPAHPWVLGAREDGAGKADHFGGLIDEVAVYDTTLQSAKIAAHFQAARDPL
ncbi:MAG: LamG domain-containing protein, partial [Thermoanaerobaculia bacterium]|nr:LamG domain-containing protein [Thermoanaerobaculia bacterium]